MAYVKTAISLDRDLFDQADALARELRIPRSRLFVLALEDLLRRYQGQRLLQELNAAYGEAADPAEEELHRRMRRQHRRIVEAEW
jgi:metal-responsive CopG/Arc/MetJ family transcriptional regulator